jgi:predicted RNA-binding protein (virulence factor B family)
MSSPMLEIGKFNEVVVVDSSPVGLLVTEYNADSLDIDEETALLPASELNKIKDKALGIGSQFSGFIYYSDTADLLVSALDIPIQLDEFAILTATGAIDSGAFFDWTLPRDLFVPQGMQHRPIDAGLDYVVRLIHDEDRQKLIGTTKLHRYLNEDGEGHFSAGDAVDLIIYDKTDLGYKAIINNTHQGLLFHSDMFKKLAIGERTSGFIKQIREDGKINLSLQITSNKGILSLSEQIIEDLEAHGGISSLTDKSPSQEIQARFDVSKNAYKKALGTLYKAKKIKIEKTHISLIK